MAVPVFNNSAELKWESTRYKDSVRGLTAAKVTGGPVSGGMGIGEFSVLRRDGMGEWLDWMLMRCSPVTF